MISYLSHIVLEFVFLQSTSVSNLTDKTFPECCYESLPTTTSSSDHPPNPTPLLYTAPSSLHSEGMDVQRLYPPPPLQRAVFHSPTRSTTHQPPPPTLTPLNFPPTTQSFNNNQNCPQASCSHDPYGMLVYNQILPSPSSPPPRYSNTFHGCTSAVATSKTHSPPPSYSVCSSLEGYPYTVTGSSVYLSPSHRYMERYAFMSSNIDRETPLRDPSMPLSGIRSNSVSIGNGNERRLSDDSDELTNAAIAKTRVISNNGGSVHFTRDSTIGAVKHSHSSIENGFLSNPNFSSKHHKSCPDAVAGTMSPGSSSFNKITLSPSAPAVSSARPSILHASTSYFPHQTVETPRQDNSCLMYPNSTGSPSYNWPYWFTGAPPRTAPQGSSSEEAEHQILVSDGDF